MKLCIFGNFVDLGNIGILGNVVYIATFAPNLSSLGNFGNLETFETLVNSEFLPTLDKMYHLELCNFGNLRDYLYGIHLIKVNVK